MSEIKVNKISPATGTAITLGDSGDTLTVPSGGTIVNSGTATGFGGGSWKFIKSQTASGVSSVDFINGTSDVVFDNTYIAYELWGFQCTSDDNDRCVEIRITDDGGTTWHTSGYGNQGVKIRAGSITAQNRDTFWFQFDATGDQTGENINFRMTFYNPAGTGKYVMGTYEAACMAHIPSDDYQGGMTSFETATAINGVRILANIGNFSCDSLKLYGLLGS